MNKIITVTVMSILLNPNSTSRPRRVMVDKWDIAHMETAKIYAKLSSAKRLKVGCVIVGEDREIRSTGFNGFPRGIDDDDERLNDRNMKYPLICHAEENAIMHAARIGVSVKGSTAYVTWPPCTRCARSLIQAGIKEIVYYSNLEIPERWIEDFNISSAMFAEAGVEVRQV